MSRQIESFVLVATKLFFRFFFNIFFITFDRLVRKYFPSEAFNNKSCFAAL